MSPFRSRVFPKFTFERRATRRVGRSRFPTSGEWIGALTRTNLRLVKGNVLNAKGAGKNAAWKGRDDGNFTEIDLPMT